MTSLAAPSGRLPRMPDWVPEGVQHYLEHTELGHPIRALARKADCHASTILRQIRRIETRRDDPLVDAALRRLGRRAETIASNKECAMAMPKTDALPDDATLSREAARILRRLCETGAVLAVAAEMDKAVVVRDSAGGSSTRTAVVAASVAQAMALKDWIAAANTGRIVRYHITAAGRSALEEMEDGAEPAIGFADAPTAFEGKLVTWEDADGEEPGAEKSRRMRYARAESPLAALARRRDMDGQPFLSAALVAAGERLREDFELGQMGSQKPAVAGDMAAPRDAASEARARVAAALTDLGPGLSDVVMRCCCYLEGLETTEKRLGWSARSGKVVLRIALIRLNRHYEDTIGPGGPMIG